MSHGADHFTAPIFHEWKQFHRIIRHFSPAVLHLLVHSEHTSVIFFLIPFFFIHSSKGRNWFRAAGELSNQLNWFRGAAGGYRTFYEIFHSFIHPRGRDRVDRTGAALRLPCPKMAPIINYVRSADPTPRWLYGHDVVAFFFSLSDTMANTIFPFWRKSCSHLVSNILLPDDD